MNTNSEHVNSEEKKSKFLKWGWVLFFAGLFVMVMSWSSMILYSPFFVVSFLFGMIGAVKRQVFYGLLLSVTSMILPPALWFYLVAHELDSANRESAVVMQALSEKTKYGSIDIEGEKAYRDGGYIYVEGRVRNNGNRDVDYVKVGVEVFDKSGAVLDTKYTYAVSSEMLRPDGAKSFQMMVRYDEGFDKYRVFVVGK